MIRRSLSLGDCRTNLLDLFGDAPALAPLLDRLAGSQSLRDGMVNLMYWLLRRSEARDLSHWNVDAGTGHDGVPYRSRFSPGSEWHLSSSMGPSRSTPQRQHIVPYAELARLYGLDDRAGRISTHPVNSLGNVTFISGQLNHFEGGGLGARPINWELEPEANRCAHMLEDAADSARSARLRGLFRDACDSMLPAAGRRAAFEELVRTRRAIMAEAFCAWGAELRDMARCEVLPIRVEPQGRKLWTSWEDQVRGAGHADCVEDALIRLLRDGRVDWRQVDRRIDIWFRLPHRPRKKGPPALTLGLGPENPSLTVSPRRWAEAQMLEMLVASHGESGEGTNKALLEIAESISLAVAGGEAEGTAQLLRDLWQHLQP